MVKLLALTPTGLLLSPLVIIASLLASSPALALQNLMVNPNDSLAQNSSLDEADQLYQEGSRILREGTDDQLPQAVEQLERA